MFKSGAAYFGEKSKNTIIKVKPQLKFETIGAKSTFEGQILQFNVNASGAGKIVYSAANLPVGASFNQETGDFVWTPVCGQQGVYSGITFVASNGSESITQDITVTVEKTVISGYIYEKDLNNQNVGLPGASIYILNLDKSRILARATSDGTGCFNVMVIPGRWDIFIRAAKDGYRS